MTEKLTVTIDGHEVQVDKGTTILAAAESVGVDIPTFCYHPGLSTPANCRMCLVNTNKASKLLPACYATCMDGMEVTTEDEKTLRTRKSTLEFILLHHPVDCPICDQAGECVLQDNYFAHSAVPSRLFTRKGHKPKATALGPNVMLDAERCIVCTRCVRFCDEVSQTQELQVVNRGERSYITTFPGRDLDNDYATCTADLCPVGALTSRDFRFKMRVWVLKSAESVCSGCAKGCNIYIDHGEGTVQRYRPRLNPEVNQWWMCDPGRLSYKQFEADRVTEARLDGEESPVPVKQAIGAVARMLLAATRKGAASVAVVPSLLGTNEDLHALSQLCTAVGLGTWYIGGRADGKADRFLQRADKNPNREGLKRILAAGGHASAPLSDLAGDISAGAVSSVLWLGHEHAPDEGLANALLTLNSRVVLASNHSMWTRGAEVSALLPVRTFEEVDGTWTNEDGLTQQLNAGPGAQGAALPTWALLWRLLRRLGHLEVQAPSSASVAVAQLAASVEAFSGLQWTEPPVSTRPDRPGDRRAVGG